MSGRELGGLADNLAGVIFHRLLTAGLDLGSLVLIVTGAGALVRACWRSWSRSSAIVAGRRLTGCHCGADIYWSSIGSAWLHAGTGRARCDSRAWPVLAGVDTVIGLAELGELGGDT